MPKCFCPEEVCGAGCFERPTDCSWSYWEPTHERFPIPKRDGGQRTLDNSVLAHRICNKLDYFISRGLSIEKDLARIEAAREAAAAANQSQSSPAAEAVAELFEPASPAKPPSKRKAPPWKSLPPAELAAHLLATPTIADSA